MNFLLKWDKNLRFSCCWVIRTTCTIKSSCLVMCSERSTMRAGHVTQSRYLQLSREETLKLLLQGEGEGQPAHVGGLSALPEVHHTLEVFLRLLILLVLPFSFSLSAFLLLLGLIFILHGHPVSKTRVVRHQLLSTKLPRLNNLPTCRGRRSSLGWRSVQTPPLGGERTSSPPTRILPCRPGLRSTPPSAARPGRKRPLR